MSDERPSDRSNDTSTCPSRASGMTDKSGSPAAAATAATQVKTRTTPRDAMNPGRFERWRLRGVGCNTSSLFDVQQILQLVHELADVAEMPVDRREADVRHFVELLQLLHDERADLGGADFALLSLLK